MVDRVDTIELAFSKDIQEQDILEDQKLLEFRLRDIMSRMDSLEAMQQAYIHFCQEHTIVPDSCGAQVSSSIKEIMLKLLGETKLDYPESLDAKHYSHYVTQQNFRIRNLLLLLRQFYSHLEWPSASYSQAVVPHFFDVRKQTGRIVNYDRWESFMISAMEEELAELYQLDEQWGLLLTSSGMAAYATIHNYITRHLSRGDNILIPVPIYHEAEALLNSIPEVQLTRLGNTDPDTIVASITPRTKVIGLTPITNDEALRFTDIDRLMQKISSINQDIFVVVDGTMSGGLIRPEKFINANSQTKLLYFESGNKYQQFEDTGMKGIIIAPKFLEKELASIRRVLGTILYDQVAISLPQSISREEHSLKMRRFARNALLLSDRINNDPQLQALCKVNYPFNSSHPDVESARRYSLEQLGGVVMFSFCNDLFYNQERLEQLIQNLINKCQENNVPLSKGDSYGFSIPRLHLGGSRTSRPFLRLCVGNRSLREMKAFLACLVDCLYEYSVLLPITSRR